MAQTIQFDKVADLYDCYVTTDFDIPYFLREASRTKGKVLELMSGTGRVSLPLLKAGVDLTCVDYSKEMLAVLQRKLKMSRLTCPVHRIDIADLSLSDRYNLIFIPFHSFSEIVEASRRLQALYRIREHLTDSGAFICTFQNPAVRTLAMDGTDKLIGRFPLQPNGSLVVRSNLKYDAANQLAHGMQYYEVYSTQGVLIEERSLEMNFYLFEKTEFQKLVCSAGFQVVSLAGNYDGAEFDPQSSPFMIWTLSRSSTGT